MSNLGLMINFLYKHFFSASVFLFLFSLNHSFSLLVWFLWKKKSLFFQKCILVSLVFVSVRFVCLIFSSRKVKVQHLKADIWEFELQNTYWNHGPPLSECPVNTLLMYQIAYNGVENLESNVIVFLISLFYPLFSVCSWLAAVAQQPVHAAATAAPRLNSPQVPESCMPSTSCWSLSSVSSWCPRLWQRNWATV